MNEQVVDCRWVSTLRTLPQSESTYVCTLYSVMVSRPCVMVMDAVTRTSLAVRNMRFVSCQQCSIRTTVSVKGCDLDSWSSAPSVLVFIVSLQKNAENF